MDTSEAADDISSKGECDLAALIPNSHSLLAPDGHAPCDEEEYSSAHVHRRFHWHPPRCSDHFVPSLLIFLLLLHVMAR